MNMSYDARSILVPDRESHHETALVITRARRMDPLVPYNANEIPSLTPAGPTRQTRRARRSPLAHPTLEQNDPQPRSLTLADSS